MYLQQQILLHNQMGKTKSGKVKTQNYAELKAYSYSLFVQKKLAASCQNEQVIGLIKFVVLLSGPLLLYLARLSDQIKTLMREALNVHLNSYLCLKFQLI